MKSDIQNRDDIIQLINTFYGKLLDDSEMNKIFSETIGIQLSTHLPIMYDFWESVLFQVGKYKNNTLEVHVELHQQYRLKEVHFKTWLGLFNQTVEELFEGTKATQAKERAHSIATIIKMKINHLDNLRMSIEN